MMLIYKMRESQCYKGFYLKFFKNYFLVSDLMLIIPVFATVWGRSFISLQNIRVSLNKYYKVAHGACRVSIPRDTHNLTEPGSLL